MKDLLEGRKKLLKIDQCKAVGYVPPKLPEFNVNNLIKTFSGDSELMSYLPGHPPVNIDKGYFFTVFITLRNSVFQNLLAHSSKTTANSSNQIRTINISQEMASLFDQMKESAYYPDKKIGNKIVINDRTSSIQKAVDKRKDNLGKRKKEITEILKDIKPSSAGGKPGISSSSSNILNTGGSSQSTLDKYKTSGNKPPVMDIER